MSDEHSALRRLFDTIPGIAPLNPADEAAYGALPHPDDLVGRMDRNLYRLLRKPLPELPSLTAEERASLWAQFMNMQRGYDDGRDNQ